MTGEELRLIRKEFRYTQQQFGKIWGVLWNSVSDWERGRYPVPEYVANWSIVLRDNPLARDQIERLTGIR